MLSDLIFRLNQLLTRWLYRNHKRTKHKQWNIEGSDD